MSEGALTYDDLLSLYRGKATAVEQLSDGVISAVAIETPLTTFLRKVDGDSFPRHVILTGNAGDGKSFAVVTSKTRSFTVTLDASAGAEDRGASPIDALAEKLTRELREGRRLLVAINRGQFERLEACARLGADPVLAEFLAEAREQATLREVWPEKSREVALIDLGLLDTASSAIVGAVLDRVGDTALQGQMSPPAKAAFQAARASLQTDAVRSYVSGVLRLARSNGYHATMRQLWSFVAFLATGARLATSEVPATLRDAVGARLFSENAEGPLFEAARELADPATVPQPGLTRLALLGRLGEELRTGVSEFRGALALPPDAEALGELMTRIAAVHDVAGAKGPLPVVEDTFGMAVKRFFEKSPGWASSPGISTPILKGIYRVLGLWCGGNSFPAWQTLCYDSSRLPRATSVASAEIDPQSLRLALPRPSPWAEEALAGVWTPPYLWLAAAGGASERKATRLRLTPKLFRLLYLSDSSSQPTRADVLNLQRWLAEFPTEHRRPSELRLGRREFPSPLQFSEDPLARRTVLAWEGQG